MEKITPYKVVSSNIDAIGWKPEALFIRFNSGVTYTYDKVPESYLEAMRTAESVGKFFHRMIKGKFEFIKLEVDPFL